MGMWDGVIGRLNSHLSRLNVLASFRKKPILTIVKRAIANTEAFSDISSYLLESIPGKDSL